MDEWGSVPERNRNVSLSHHVQTESGAWAAPTQLSSVVLLRGVRSLCEADRSLHSLHRKLYFYTLISLHGMRLKAYWMDFSHLSTGKQDTDTMHAMYRTHHPFPWFIRTTQLIHGTSNITRNYLSSDVSRCLFPDCRYRGSSVHISRNYFDVRSHWNVTVCACKYSVYLWWHHVSKVQCKYI
jgi:hypothetical protein